MEKKKKTKGIVLIELIKSIIVIAIFAVIGAMLFTGCTGNEPETGYLQCKAKAKKMGFEYDWGLVQGCMIKVRGQWIDINKYRIAE